MLERTNTNIKEKWHAIRLIINRKKVEQNNCVVPSTALGKHYSTVAEKLAAELPNITNDDIPSSSKKKHNKKISKLYFIFNNITDRQVYELILKLDSTKGPGTDNLDTKSLKSIANIISTHLTILSMNL